MNKLYFISFVILIVAGLLIIGHLWSNFRKLNFQNAFLKQDINCPIQIEERIVRGNSLEPLIKNGQTVIILFGYYNCHPVQRDDVVLYRYAGNKNPLIKIIKGVPGDKWTLQETNDGYNIIVNDAPLKNSQGNLYVISESNSKILKLYIHDYPIIPANTFLLL